MSKADLIAKLEAEKCDLRISAGTKSDIHREAYNQAIDKAIEIFRQHDEPQTVAEELARALEFYLDEWQENATGDFSTPGLSRSWMEPTDKLWEDAGRKAAEALAKYRKGRG